MLPSSYHKHVQMYRNQEGRRRYRLTHQNMAIRGEMQLIQVQINQNSLDAEPTIKLQSKHMMQKVETTVIWIMIRYRYYISMIMIPYILSL